VKVEKKLDEDVEIDDENEENDGLKTIWDWKLINDNKPIWTKKLVRN